MIIEDEELTQVKWVCVCGCVDGCMCVVNERKIKCNYYQAVHELSSCSISLTIVQDPSNACLRRTTRFGSQLIASMSPISDQRTCRNSKMK